ncbi:MAG: cytochrome c [Verrucomicrobia bacterium]|nr:cytochrome c [Verrucomicrobiota bacterium]
MSDEHSSNDDSDGGVSLLGNSLAIIVPLLMILMLAVTGIAFVGNIEKSKKPEETSANSTGSAPAPAATPAATGSKNAAPDGVDPAAFAAGKTSFALCAACHGMDGKGMKIGTALMAPSLIGSEIVLGDPDKFSLVILKGLKKETADFMGVMAPLGASLDDKQLAGVMTYVRNSFGNSAPAITVETTKKARERFADITMETDPGGVSRLQLDKVLDAHK